MTLDYSVVVCPGCGKWVPEYKTEQHARKCVRLLSLCGTEA